MPHPSEQEQRQWQEQGYLVFENAIQGEELRRLQAAFDHWAAACKEDWLKRVAGGELSATYYDIPAPLEKDEIFINLVDHPSYYGYLKAFTGDDLLFLGPQVRTVPLWVMSYTGWHPDVGPNSPLHIKVQIYVNDVSPDSGEFAYVPGSHRPGSGPYARVRNPEAMPGHRKFPGRAGDAIMFNARGWHAAMDNHTDTPRKSIILIYEKRTPERVRPEAFASIAHRLHGAERRRLFSVEG